MTEKERYTVSSSQIVDKVKELIHEGNIRRVRLLHNEKVIFEIPLSVGAPVAAVGILAAPLVAECTIEVEKIEDTE